MKYTFVLLFNCIAIQSLSAQKSVDTLFANERQMHSIFFEHPIDKGILGASNYAFTFNREKAEPLGLLQATKGEHSNLLVMTKDGGIYSFVVSYKSELQKFTSFIPSDSRIRPEEKKSSIDDTTTVVIPKAKTYEKLSRQLLNRTTQFQQIRNQNGIRLKITESIYHGDEVYMVYEIKNNSAINYNIKDLQLLSILSNNSKNASKQETLVNPLFSFQKPEIIPQGATIRFIVIYPKFTLNRKEDLKVILREKNGSRNFNTRIK